MELKHGNLTILFFLFQDYYQDYYNSTHNSLQVYNVYDVVHSTTWRRPPTWRRLL